MDLPSTNRHAALVPQQSREREQGDDNNRLSPQTLDHIGDQLTSYNEAARRERYAMGKASATLSKLTITGTATKAKILGALQVLDELDKAAANLQKFRKDIEGRLRTMVSSEAGAVGARQNVAVENPNSHLPRPTAAIAPTEARPSQKKVPTEIVEISDDEDTTPSTPDRNRFLQPSGRRTGVAQLPLTPAATPTKRRYSLIEIDEDYESITPQRQRRKIPETYAPTEQPSPSGRVQSNRSAKSTARSRMEYLANMTPLHYSVSATASLRGHHILTTAELDNTVERLIEANPGLVDLDNAIMEHVSARGV